MGERVGINRCESPLEIALAQAFTRQCRWQWRQPDHHPWEVGRWEGYWLSLAAQPKLGRFRPDFAITSALVDRCPTLMIVVEVDGHDFHERTKEQARHDRSRDRYFTALDVRVFRFTGSEVHRDADACAEEVMRYACNVASEAIFDEFIKYVQRQEAPPPGSDPPPS